MSIELDRPGGGVAAFMLSVGTLLALEKNSTLVHDGWPISGAVLGRAQDYRCGDERAKPGCMEIRSRSPRATSGASRSRSEPETARGDAMCLISAICGSQGRTEGNSHARDVTPRS